MSRKNSNIFCLLIICAYLVNIQCLMNMEICIFYFISTKKTLTQNYISSNKMFACYEFNRVAIAQHYYQMGDCVITFNIQTMTTRMHLLRKPIKCCTTINKANIVWIRCVFLLFTFLCDFFSRERRNSFYLNLQAIDTKGVSFPQEFAMVCSPDKESQWTDTDFLMRKVVNPVCHGISITILLTVAIVYFVVPSLR